MDQDWFWTERWQEMEREADADIASSRLRRFDNVDDFLADLDDEKKVTAQYERAVEELTEEDIACMQHARDTAARMWAEDD